MPELPIVFQFLPPKYQQTIQPAQERNNITYSDRRGCIMQ